MKVFQQRTEDSGGPERSALREYGTVFVEALQETTPPIPLTADPRYLTGMPPIALNTLAHALGGTLIGDLTHEVLASRVVSSGATTTPGSLFVAVRGHNTDGHQFVNQAFSLGAVGAVVEDPAVLNGRPGIVVQDSRVALSRLAALFAGDPSNEMKVIGVTGTNGKTTTTWIIYHILQAIGGGSLRIGTLGWEYLGRTGAEGVLTSPDPISLHSIMRQACDEGAASCVMETSSHALHQARVKDVAFDVAVFTNLTRDHLDYHRTFDNYFAAKRHLFELLRDSTKATRGAVINGDDAYGQRLIAEIHSLGLNDWSFGRAANCTVQITSITETPGAMQIEVSLTRLNRALTISAPFIGAHNAENVVAAFAACCALGYEPGWVAEAIRGVPQVPGRLERVGTSAVRVFVDYAHTPDALERAIAALRPSTEGKLWVVFGCGGDRDKGKRPIMGTVAASGADRVVVTSDNPRTEDPNGIISDVLSSGIAPCITEVDRRRAIVEAVNAASPGDTVLIAGKGHENYQIIGNEKSHFSDQEVAHEALGLAGSNRG